MIEQRQNLELFYMNDTVEEQNRILRQINDFIIVLSKDLCEHVGTQVRLFFKTRENLIHSNFLQSIVEPPIDFIERLQYVFNLVSKIVKTSTTDSTDEDVSFPNSVFYCIRLFRIVRHLL